MKCVLVLLLCAMVASGASRQKRHCAEVSLTGNGTVEEKLRRLEALGIHVEEDSQVVPFQEFSAIVFQFQLPSEEDLEPFKVTKLVGLCKDGAEEGTIEKDLCDIHGAARPFAEAARKHLKLPLASAFKVPGVHHWKNSSDPTCDDLAGPFNTTNLSTDLFNTCVNKLSTCSQGNLRAHEVFISFNASQDLDEVYVTFAHQFQHTFDVVDGNRRRKWKNETTGYYSIQKPVADVLLKTLDSWTYTQAVAEVQRWKEAASACSQSKLPTSLISQDLWTAELKKLKSNMSNSTKLILEDLYEAFQDSRLVACAMFNGTLVVRAIVPVKTNNQVWKAVTVWSKDRFKDVEGNTSCIGDKLVQKSTFAIRNSNVIEIDSQDVVVKVSEGSTLKNKCAYNILKQVYLEAKDADVSHAKLCRSCKINCE